MEKEKLTLQNDKQAQAFYLSLFPELSQECLVCAYEEGSRHIETQFARFTYIRNRCFTFLGWALGAATSLMAAIVVQAPGGWTTTLVMSVYGLIFALSVCGNLIFGGLFNKRFFNPGGSPSEILGPKRLEYLKQFPTEEHYNQLLRGLAFDLEHNSNRNEQHILPVVMTYRRTIYMMIAGILVGAALIAVLTCLPIFR